MGREFLQGHCVVNIKIETPGYGDTIALSSLFRELKNRNPAMRFFDAEDIPE